MCRYNKTFLIVAGVWAVCRIAASGQAQSYTFTTIAGSPRNPASPTAYDDGTNNTALFLGPSGVAVDNLGNLYVADQLHYVIRKATHIGANWVVTTIAGTPGECNFEPPIVNGTNARALFSFPTGVAVDPGGNVYVADENNNAIRKITPVAGTTNWIVSTIAGNGDSGHADGSNGAATFSGPTGVAVDANSNLYVADQFNNAIRKITPLAGTTKWVVTTIAGLAGTQGSANGVGTNASFYNPSGVAVDPGGNVYVADQDNNTIRMITPVAGTTNWVVSTIAGSPFKSGFNDGTNSAAQFDTPSGVAVDANGNLYVADQFNYTIRKIVPVGTNWVVSTIGGQADNNGTRDGVGTNALFYYPYGLAADRAGNVYVADTGNDTLRLGSLPAPQLTGMTVSQGAAKFDLNGPAGSNCVLQTSSDLLTWLPLLTNTIPAGGAILIEDPCAATNSRRFYRAVLP